MCMQLLHKQEEFLPCLLCLEMVHSIHCITQGTRHWNVNHSFNDYSREPTDRTEKNVMFCQQVTATELLCVSWTVDVHGTVWLSLARWMGKRITGEAMSQRPFCLREECNERTHLTGIPVWPIWPSPSAINNFHYKQPWLFNIMRFTTVNLNHLH